MLTVRYIWIIFVIILDTANACNKRTIWVGEDRCNGDPCCSYTDNINRPMKYTNVSIYISDLSSPYTLTKQFEINRNLKYLGIFGYGISPEITCQDDTPIIHTLSNTDLVIEISNLLFKNCGSRVNVRVIGTTRTGEPKMFSTAFYFKRADFTLSQVTMNNSKGYNLITHICPTQKIENCTFQHNRNTECDKDGSIYILIYKYSQPYNITVERTILTSGTAKGNDLTGGIEVYLGGDYTSTSISILNCTFHKNYGKHLYVHTKKRKGKEKDLEVFIEDSTFSSEAFSNECCDFAITISTLTKKQDKITISNSRFIQNNNYGALAIRNTNTISITECLFSENGWSQIDVKGEKFTVNISITNTDFINNTKPLTLELPDNCSVKFSDCLFDSSFVYYSEADYFNSALIVTKQDLSESSDDNDEVILQNSNFTNHMGKDGNCSSIRLSHVTITLDSVNIENNNCTGIIALASTIKFRKTTNLLNNNGLQGGGLQLRRGQSLSREFSRIIILQRSSVRIINSTTLTHGGGIYTDQNCIERHKDFIEFPQFDSGSEKCRAYFEGNNAMEGGHAIFGGCLNHDNYTVLDNVLPGERICIAKPVSESLLAEYPKQIRFCYTDESLNDVIHCNTTNHISVFSGEVFTLSLAAVDDDNRCYPTGGIVKVVDNNYAKIKRQQDYQRVEPKCERVQYSISVNSDIYSNTHLQFKLQGSRLVEVTPALLNILITDCPTGFKLSREDTCACIPTLTDFGIKCDITNLSFIIPAPVWIGKVNNKIAVHQNCPRCKTKGNTTIWNVSNNSDTLCAPYRSGIMCGKCIKGFSLRLGEGKCGDCSNTSYKGILLILFFGCIGIVLILLLAALNLTISTGLINGLIFYSNIIHASSGTFLPVRENDTHLAQFLKFLSVFLAWMNLDFGIDTCFFDGYDTYISTWIQFLFPIYIWLLIFVVILLNRYSGVISKLTRSNFQLFLIKLKLTSSNIVSVLATLMLLSYSKVLITVFSAIFGTELIFVDDSNKDLLVWLQDSNIYYLQGKHIALFIVSLTVIVLYLLPYTFLVVATPYLQAYSHSRYLHWINRIKPFLDANYGSYEAQYRYWPGILLIARLGIFGMLTFSFSNDDTSKTATIALLTVGILALWVTIGKVYKIQFHNKKIVEYLELFFHLNLLLFSISTLYLYFFYKESGHRQHQEVAAAIMVGSVFLIFCGIMSYHIYDVTGIWMLIQKIIVKYNTWKYDRRKVDKDALEETKTSSSIISTTEVEIPLNQLQDKLREPLLT